MSTSKAAQRALVKDITTNVLFTSEKFTYSSSKICKDTRQNAQNEKLYYFLPSFIIFYFFQF